VPPVAVGGCDVGELDDVLTLFVAEALHFRRQEHHGAAWDRREFVEVDTPHVVQHPTTQKWYFERHHTINILKTYRKSLMLMSMQDAKSLQVLHIWQREFGCVVRLVSKDM